MDVGCGRDHEVKGLLRDRRAGDGDAASRDGECRGGKGETDPHRKNLVGGALCGEDARVLSGADDDARWTKTMLPLGRAMFTMGALLLIREPTNT